MKIAIHKCKFGFSDRWIKYCSDSGIQYKIVDCYKNDILEQLSDCDGLMWHFQQTNSKDVIFAKELFFALGLNGYFVFPDINSMWHFDDKIAQKYLFEKLKIPAINTWIFYSKADAMKWAFSTELPKVFKLRSGAGSSNVRLINSRQQLNRVIKRSFGRGFRQYNPISNLNERIRRYKLGKAGLWDVIKGLIRIIYRPRYDKVAGIERDYLYVQEFLAGNQSDIRVVVIDNKAFAIKRMVRENDFRASGSGSILYGKENFNDDLVRQAFFSAEKLNSGCVAFDFIFNGEIPLIAEISFGFVKEGYDNCEGFWDSDLNWHPGPFNPYGWMVDSLVKRIQKASL